MTPGPFFLSPVRGPVENERMGDEGREREGGKEVRSEPMKLDVSQLSLPPRIEEEESKRQFSPSYEDPPPDSLDRESYFQN